MKLQLRYYHFSGQFDESPLCSPNAKQYFDCLAHRRRGYLEIIINSSKRVGVDVCDPLRDVFWFVALGSLPRKFSWKSFGSVALPRWIPGYWATCFCR